LNVTKVQTTIQQATENTAAKILGHNCTVFKTMAQLLFLRLISRLIWELPKIPLQITGPVLHRLDVNPNA